MFVSILAHASHRLLAACLVAVLVGAVLVIPPIAHAQSELATVFGRVVDQQGAVIVGAEVEIKNVETNVSVVRTTNSDGLYSIPSLHPGHYVLTVRQQGFKTVSVTDVTLNVQDNLARNFQLQVGSTSESVTVAADSTALDTADATVKTVVDHQFISQLPLNGRSFQTLFQLTPGVTVAAVSYSTQGQFSVDGQRTNTNYFMVDGASANVGVASGYGQYQSLGGTLPALTATGGTNSLVSVDSVQEFTIQTSTYAPEFGRTPGAQISIATRSGTNQFHGSVFDYFRNDVLDANNWFARRSGLAKPKERQNDFGGTLGGPIFRDKTFFFVSYEGLRLRQPAVGLSDVPTVAVRSSAPAAVQPYLKAYPLPNGSDEGNGLAPANYSISNPTELDSFSIRADHHISGKLSAFLRFSHAPSSSANRGNNTSLNTILSSSFSTDGLTAGASYVLTPRMADELRVNWTRATASTVFTLDTFGGASPYALSSVLPASVAASDGALYFDFLNAKSGFLELGPNASNRDTQVNVIDNLSWQRGAHLLKVGLDLRHLDPVAGHIHYAQQDLFFGIPSLLAGTVDITALVSEPGNVRLSLSNYSAYAQDTWRSLPRLTTTYGVRWDYNPAPTGSSAGITPIILQNLATPSAISIAPQGGPLYHAPKNAFAPRLGVAYQLRDSSRTAMVVRAGAGIFYDLGIGGLGTVFSKYPFQTVVVKSGKQPFPLSATAAAPPVVTGPPFPAIQAFPNTLKQPYTYHWNLAFEQSLGASQELTIGYVGSSGHSLMRGLSLFPPTIPSTFKEIDLTSNTGYSHYDALQVSLRRRVGAGLNALVAYTWGHSLDNSSDDQGTNPPTQILTPVSDYGSSDFDIRHTFSAAADYQIPAPHGSKIGSAILRGWGVNILTAARTAPPVNVTITRFLPFGQYYLRPDIVPGQPLYLRGTQFPGGKAFNAAAFADPTSSAQGDFRRNTLRGFGLVQQDISIRRQFAITERMHLEARVEAFNILNHPNFFSPSAAFEYFGNLGTETGPGKISVSPTFGISQSLLNNGLNGGYGFSPLYQLGGPRSLQAALRLQF